MHYISQAAPDGSHLTAIAEVLKAGGKWVQLRIKDQSPSLILEYAVQAKGLCDEYGAKLIINDHPEIAKQANAHGVHLGLEDMPVAEARKLLGPDFIIGGTANTMEHLRQRITEGVDYIGLGPYRFTKTKKKLSPILGLEGYHRLLREMNMISDVPVIAIGGILMEDVPQLMTTGIHGIALSGTLTNVAGLSSVIKEIYTLLKVNELKH